MLSSDAPSSCPFNTSHVLAYLERIGWKNNQLPVPDLNTLESILNHHIKAIPFGALSINYFTQLDKPAEHVVNKLDPRSTRGISVEPMAVFEKLVTQRREGYCFEHNSLIRWILEFIGYDCISTCARIFEPSKLETTGEEELDDITHWVNLVKLDGAIYLVDGGFSHYGTIRPVPVDINADPTPCEGNITHRIIQDTYQDKEHFPNSFGSPLGYRLEVRYGTRPAWKPVYTFTLKPYYQADLKALNFYMVHSPDKIFRQHMLLSRFIPDGHIALKDTELITRINGKKVEIRQIESEDARRTVFKEVFGIEIPDSYEEHLPSAFGTLGAAKRHS